jgi:hypothetical protein
MIGWIVFDRKVLRPEVSGRRKERCKLCAITVSTNALKYINISLYS